MIKEYLNNRCISDEVIEKFNIHEIGHSIPIIKRGIAIPINDPSGKFMFNKFRRHPIDDNKTFPSSEPYPKYVYELGSKVTVAFYDKAKDYKDIVICEGEFDALALWSNGIPAISSTGGCMSFKIEWIERIIKKHNVTIVFDNDEAGMKALGILINKCNTKIRLADRSKIKFMFLPEESGINDVTDYLKKHNVCEFKKIKTYTASTRGINIALNKLNNISFYDNDNLLNIFKRAFDIQENSYVIPKNYSQKNNGEYSNAVIKAKSYPIPNLIKIGRDKKSTCLWHDDSTPSLHYNQDRNTVKCFACGAAGDSIDVYKQLHGCSFKEAIEKLS